MHSQNKRNNHWFGSTISASSYLQTGEYRPVLVLWTSGSSVLSSELVHPDEAPAALARTLSQALARETQGPELLLVENSETIGALRPLAANVDFEVESDELVAVMAEDMMETMPELSWPDTYFEKGIDADTLRDFFIVDEGHPQGRCICQRRLSFFIGEYSQSRHQQRDPLDR